MTGRALVYVRRSSPDASDGSYEAQRDQALALAARHGYQAPEVVEERGRSGAARGDQFGGTGRGGNRPAWDALREDIRSGGVDALLAVSLSRLARSLPELRDLLADCQRNGTAIILGKEGTLDAGSASGRLMLNVLGSLAEFEADVASERAKDRVAHRRAAGQHLGVPPHGYRVGQDGRLEPDPAEQRAIRRVLEVLDQSSGPAEAARTLNAEGVPTRSGRPFSDTMVRRLEARARGQVLPGDQPHRRGSARYKVRALTRLLACGHCGRTLTAHGKPGSDWVAWYCHGASADKDHPRPASITDTAAREALREAAQALRVPGDRLELVRAATADLEALDAREDRLNDALEAGAIAPGRARDRLEAIETERARLEATVEAVELPQAVPWDAPPEDLNEVLRAMWSRVTVDTATKRVDVTWREGLAELVNQPQDTPTRAGVAVVAQTR